MSGRWIDPQVFVEGIQEFARRANAKLSKQDDGLAYLVEFPGEKYSARIGNDGLGMDISYVVICGVVKEVSLARVFLQKNWGGVEGTPFFFSVHVENGQALLFLEAHHFIDPDINAKDIANLLGKWNLLWSQVEATLE